MELDWPILFVAVLAILIVVNIARCHRSGKTVIARKIPSHTKKITITANNISPGTVNQTASMPSSQSPVLQAPMRPVQTPVIIAPGIKHGGIPVETFQSTRIKPDTMNKKMASKVKPKTFAEGFARIQLYPKTEGVNMGSFGCQDSQTCTDCYKNLNDQINLGVNNYNFPYCNSITCVNGCDIQDQVNEYQYDYRMGVPSTELEKSSAGLYTSLNVDGCSQYCPSANILPFTECKKN